MNASDIKGIIVLLCFSTAVAFGFNSISPHGIALVGQWEKDKGVVNAKAKSDAIDASKEVLSAERVLQMIAKKERIIIDVRSEDFFELGHIPGALNFPLTRFDDDVPRLMQQIKKETPVLVYCSGIYCTDSHTFATHMRQMGYKDVLVFSGGFEQWEESGNEIRTGQ